MQTQSNTPYIVSARKYRPATFKSVVGQKALTATLKNAIDTGRVAQAYLFTGPRGVGKTSCARIFAKTINCLSPTSDGEACGHCDSCRAIDEGNSYNIIELDAASNNSVENMRNLIDQVNVPPQVGRYRIFIIDEVHMLTTQAFNAFLKTLEEPPKHVVFIMATTEKHKVIPTILSRCQIYDFKRITIDDMVEHLQYVAQCENIEVEPAALNVIAMKADGAMRDALSIFDQISASSMGHVSYQATLENLNVLDYEYYFRLIDTFIQADVAEALLLYKAIRDKGFDSLFFVNGLAQHIRDLMVAADPRTVGLLEVSRDVARRYVEQAKKVPIRWYYSALKILNDCDVQYRTATNKQLLVELTLIKLCQLSGVPTPDQPGSNLKPVQPQQPVQPKSAPTPAPASAQSAPARNSGPAPAQIQPQTASGSQSPKLAETPASASPAQPAAAATRKPGPTEATLATAPQRPHRAAGVRTTLRIHDSDDNDSLPPENEGPQRNAFSQQDLDNTWLDYAVKIENEDPHLAEIMKSIKPILIDGLKYRITTSTLTGKQAIDSNLQKIAEHIRSTLKNDGITFQTETSANTERKAPTLTPIEFLKKVIEEKPFVGDLLRSIDAEMI